MDERIWMYRWMNEWMDGQVSRWVDGGWINEKDVVMDHKMDG